MSDTRVDVRYCLDHKSPASKCGCAGRGMSTACKHPKESRALMPGGYDIACGECEQIVGRVAIFPDAVLGRDEARELLGMLTEAAEGSGVRAKLTTAARTAP